MSKRLKKYAPTLQFLSKCDKHTAASIVKSSKPDFISCVSDICHNVLQDRVKLTPKEKKALAKHKAKLRKLASSKTTQKTKRELIQKGGVFGILLKTIAPILAPLVKTFLGGT